MSFLALLLPACAVPKPPAGDSGGEDTAAPADTFCETEGLTTRPWSDAGTDADWDLVAPDVTFSTLGGDVTLSSAWTGCDTWMFVYYTNVDLDRTADIRDWLEGAPRNARWVFLSSETGGDAITADMQALKDRVDVAINNITEDDAELGAHLAGRVHYMTQGPRGLDLYGGFVSSNSRTMRGWAIDRSQVIREPGYWADPVTGWSTSPATFLHYDLIGFNYQSDLDDRLASREGAEVLRLWDAQAVSGYADVDIELPADLSAFDSLEADLTFSCGGHPDTDYCGEWDYLAYLYLCDADDPDTTDVDERETCDTEVGRWITTYGRPGRWVHDITPFLAMLQEGSERRFRVVPANSYIVTLDLVFSNQGKGWRPVAAEPLWTGGGFDANYDANHAPMTFTPPSGTTHVEIVAVTSGHGFGADTENCAEFCNHQHTFTVNDGASYMQEFDEVADRYGCAEQVDEGTVAGQYGTWVYGRGGWCPGKQVDVWTADITGDVTVGSENSLVYTTTVDDQEYVPDYDVANSTGFTGRIDLVSYVVYYE